MTRTPVGAAVLLAAVAVIGTTAVANSDDASPPPTTAAAVVRVDAAWVTLTPAEMAAGPAAPPPAVTAANVVCQARTVGFDGQPVTVKVERSTSVITSLQPIVAPNVTVYGPVNSDERTGVSFTVTSRLADGCVLAEVDATMVAHLPRVDRPTAATQPADPVKAAFLTRPDVWQQRVQTAVRLRPGVPTIVGGMTDQPGLSGDRRVVCLILTAHVEPAPATRPAGR